MNYLHWSLETDLVCTNSAGSNDYCSPKNYRASAPDVLYRNDGGIDIIVINRDGPAHLLLNAVAERGHWARFRVLTAAGADALGARLDLEIGNRHLRREVRAAYSYLASNDPRFHVGLGEAARVDRVTITWPTGESKTFGPFPADRDHVLRP